MKFNDMAILTYGQACTIAARSFADVFLLNLLARHAS